MDYYYFAKAVFKILRVMRTPDKKWVLSRRFPVLFFLPHMTKREYFAFKNLCKSKNVFLEYGSGGSTIHLLKNKKTVLSVESNPAFYKFMRSLKFVKRAMDRNFQYRFVNLGPTNKWGKPLTEENNDNWPQYYEQVWNEIDPSVQKVDVVFIDGRFRVSCCLYSLLKAIQYNWTEMIFVIHDFWGRERYHSVLDFLQEISSTDSLAFFRMKKNINVSKVQASLAEYSFEIA